jgi:hypothetical protein
MEAGDAEPDTYTQLGSTTSEAAVTRAEKDKVINDILSRYDHRVGDVVMCDDGALTRLLTTLQFDNSDNDVGEYLCSFLVA